MAVTNIFLSLSEKEESIITKEKEIEVEKIQLADQRATLERALRRLQ